MGAWLTAGGGTRDNDSTDNKLSCDWECCGASLSEAAHALYMERCSRPVDVHIVSVQTFLQVHMYINL